MSIGSKYYTIEDMGAGLCVVYNVAGKKVAFNEESLLFRIKNVEGGGQSAANEKKALFNLQRQKQIKQKL